MTTTPEQSTSEQSTSEASTSEASTPVSERFRQVLGHFCTGVTVITTMDGECAARLKELHDDGLDDDTIIMFYGDHGAGMPRSKRWPYNSGLQVPLIAYFPPKWAHLAPKGYAPGSRSHLTTTGGVGRGSR